MLVSIIIYHIKKMNKRGGVKNEKYLIVSYIFFRNLLFFKI